MLDLLLIMTLGFLGSFGHCLGMCGPLAAAFSLSRKQETPTKWQEQLSFHILLNLGRLISYALIGAGIGALGSILIAGGYIAGSGSGLRRAIALLTGIMLIWFGILQIQPKFLPRIPLIHPLAQGKLHDRLSRAMVKLSLHTRWWTPAALGMVWGLMPCGFLYAAQIKAAETGNMWMGAATMLAFGLGTLPTMLGVGVSTSLVSADRRSQLFRLAGWVTIIVGVITLLRTGEMMGDYTGHASLVCLMLALIARPIRRFWPQLLQYRRALGVGAFVLAVAHMVQAVQHTFGWDLNAISFLLPTHQLAIAMGAIAIALLTPAALTSFNNFQKNLGQRWRQIHLLSVPALLLCVIHAILIGSHYLGNLEGTLKNQVSAALLGIITLGVLLVRSRWVWSLLSLEKFYAAPLRYK